MNRLFIAVLILIGALCFKAAATPKNIFISCSAPTEVTVNDATYSAYTIGAYVYPARSTPVVGKILDKYILHIVSQDAVEIAALKSHKDYIGESYIEIAVKDRATFESMTEVSFDNLGEINRAKVAIWDTLGRPTPLHIGVCHTYLGVDPEIDGSIVESTVKEYDSK